MRKNKNKDNNISLSQSKIYKYLKNNCIAFLIGGLISLVVTVSATTIIHSRQIRYKDDKGVDTAINELYQKSDQLYGYHIGDSIKVNGVDFYVIADSGAGQDYVVALKKDPLTVAEANNYGGVGTANNHVNRYTELSQGTSYSSDGFGSMAYYSSSTCGYVNGAFVSSNCISSYNDSDVKYVVDAWTSYVFHNNELLEIDGYDSRLIFVNEYNELSSVYDWRYNINYAQWTMDFYTNTSHPCVINKSGSIYGGSEQYISNGNAGVVRPVINVKKSVVQRNN